MGRALKLSILAALLAVALLSFACGKRKHSAATLPSVGSGGLQAADTAIIGSGGFPTADSPPAEQSLDEVLSELDAFACPEGVDASLWSELKSALEKALSNEEESRLSSRDSVQKESRLENRDSFSDVVRFVSSPPTGEPNRVNDLSLADNGDGTFTLTWHYRNLGDYDQNGVVAISDITPLAQHFDDAVPEDDLNRNSLQAVIDGSGNGKIGIEDVTPIAAGFAREVAGYSVECCEDEAFSSPQQLMLEPLPGQTPVERLTVSAHLTGDFHRYVAVRPVDSQGTAGEFSNVIDTSTSITAAIGAYPTSGEAPLTVNFTGFATGGEAPFNYQWDFTDDGVWDSGERYAEYTYEEPATYFARLKVSDSAGLSSEETVGIIVSEPGRLSGDWSMFGRDAAHNRRSPLNGPGSAVLKWRYHGGDYDRSSPAFDVNGVAYIGCDDGCLYAVNPDGTLKWKFITGSVIYSSPAVGVDGTIYIGSVDCFLYAVNPDGTEKWRLHAGWYVESSPTIGPDGTVYIGSNDRHVRAVASDGSLIWSYRTEGYVETSPALDEQGNVYVASEDGFLYVLNRDGELRWKYETGELRSSPAVGTDGTVFVGGDDGYVYAVDADGTLEWKVETGGPIWSSPAVGEDGTVYIGSDDGNMHAVSSNGTPLWEYETGDRVRSSPALDNNGVVYFGSHDGYVYAVSHEGSLMWKYRTGDQVRSSPAIGPGNSVYVGSCDGYLYAIGQPSQEPPQAIISAQPMSGEPPLTVTFDASGSTDSDGYIAKYEWDFNCDGTWDLDSGAVPSAEFTYEQRGIYTAVLRVTDNCNALDEDRIEVTVGGTAQGDWWMFGREPTHNRRSPYVGSQNANLRWRCYLGNGTSSSPVLAADGTIYIGSNSPFLYAVSPNGSLKWKLETSTLDWVEIDATPAVGPDGTVYVANTRGYLLAVAPDGTEKWSVGGTKYSPTLGQDNIIYVGGSNIRAVDTSGCIKWRYDIENVSYGNPAISSNGILYVGCGDGCVYAISKDGALRWKYQTGASISSSAAIGSDGTLYIGSSDGSVYALNSNGSLRWKCPTGGEVSSSPAIGEDSTIYVGTGHVGFEHGNLIAIDENGSIIWRYPAGFNVSGSPAVGADGTVYIGGSSTSPEPPYYCYMYAINSDGSLKWKYETDGGLSSSPAIGADGTVYIGCGDGYLYAFGQTPD